MSQKKNSYFSFANARWEKNQSSGFTLIEMLVVTAIISVIMSIVFTSQSSFNKTLILKNTAYDIALTLRNAQTYGLGGRVQDAPSGVGYNIGYGVHFNKGASSFTLFADTGGTGCHIGSSLDSPDYQPGDCIYMSAQDQKVTEYKLGNGISIESVCAYLVAQSKWDCTSFNFLDVVFARPNAETFLRADTLPYSSVCINLTSPQGGTRAVKVTSAGQIIADYASCL